MPWKMDGDAVVMQDGNPIFVYPDGKESALDGAQLTSKIAQLNGEAADWRKQLRSAEERLRLYDGIEDPDAARKALSTVANLDSKKLIDAGEAEKVKAEVQKAFESKLSDAQKLLADKEALLEKEMIGGRFSRSKVVSEKLIIPPDLVQAAFGSAFRIEDGNVVAYDRNGSKIFSREKPGELADFDEALSVLVSEYPNRDSIMKAPEGSGTGSQRGIGGQHQQKQNLTSVQKIAAGLKELGG